MGQRHLCYTTESWQVQEKLLSQDKRKCVFHSSRINTWKKGNKEKANKKSSSHTSSSNKILFFVTNEYELSTSVLVHLHVVFPGASQIQFWSWARVLVKESIPNLSWAWCLDQGFPSHNKPSTGFNNLPHERHFLNTLQHAFCSAATPYCRTRSSPLETAAERSEASRQYLFGHSAINADWKENPWILQA